jgi:microcystin-dependent protein
MSGPYVGEIRIFAGNFAPNGWAFCDGAIMAIDANPILFQLIGTTYGGDGQTTFALPDLRGRLPLHQGSGVNGVTFVIGEVAGTETVTLNVQQIPAHSHPVGAQSGPASQQSLTGGVWAALPGQNAYINSAGTSPMNPGSIGNTGNNQPHDNFMQYLCVSFIISLFGVFPSPT